jgi:hypothetical protein
MIGRAIFAMAQRKKHDLVHHNRHSTICCGFAARARFVGMIGSLPMFDNSNDRVSRDG